MHFKPPVDIFRNASIKRLVAAPQDVKVPPFALFPGGFFLLGLHPGDHFSILLFHAGSIGKKTSEHFQKCQVGFIRLGIKPGTFGNVPFVSTTNQFYACLIDNVPSVIVLTKIILGLTDSVLASDK